MEIVELQQPQLAKSVDGIVIDPSGAALPGVTVEERSADWKNVVRSTETHENGRFHFSRERKESTYNLQFYRAGFNWLRLTAQLDRTAKKMVTVKMPIGT